MEHKNGQALSIEEEAEKTVEKLLMKYYRRGYRDGYKARERELHPEVHYCRECIYWAGDETSIGRRCTNTNRRRGRTRPSGSSDYKYPSTKACKSGFEPLPDPKQVRLEDIIKKEEGEKNED